MAVFSLPFYKDSPAVPVESSIEPRPYFLQHLSAALKLVSQISLYHFILVTIHYPDCPENPQPSAFSNGLLKGHSSNTVLNALGWSFTNNISIYKLRDFFFRAL